MKIKIFFLILSLFIVYAFNNLSAFGISDSKGDSALYKVFVQGKIVGEIKSSIDGQNNYRRLFSLFTQDSKINLKMNINSDSEGRWQKIEIVNPTSFNTTADHSGGKVSYMQNDKEINVELPDDYILFDDYGIQFEEMMLAKYDLNKKGIQKFQRFRIPETAVPGNIIETSLEFEGESSHILNGTDIKLLKFDWEFAGVKAWYYCTADFRILLIESPAERSVIIREGCEDLLKEQSGQIEISQPVYQVITFTEKVVLRDGINLATDIYLPSDASGEVPVILLRTPYKKQMHQNEGNYFASRGYAVAIQDVRGRFDSEGIFEPFVNDADDGYDTIEWLLEQGWCDGKVGMMGGSYSAVVQFLTANKKPDGLITIIPNGLPSDPFMNYPYEFGTFMLSPSLWIAQVYEYNATDITAQDKMRQIMSREYEDQLNFLPVIDIDKKIFGREIFYWRNLITKQPDDPFWKRSAYLEDLMNLEIPVFLQSGWYDTHSIGTKHAYTALRNSKSKFVKMIIGPWDHVNQIPKTGGTTNIGSEANIDLIEEYLKWFDYWLKGIDNKILEEPAVSLYILNSRRWINTNSYPVPESEEVILFLGSEKGANTLSGDGKLDWNFEATSREYDSYVYNPENPTPAIPYRFEEGMKSFNEITSTRQDLLVYQSDALANDVILAGPISAKIYASSSAVDTDWFVTLYAVKEDGSHVQMVRGCMRARFRNSLAHPELMIPNEVYEFNMDLWQFGIKLEKGWRLRVEISSSYYPQYSRNLNTGKNNEMESSFVTARQKIYHSKKYPSQVILHALQSND